MTDKKTYVSFKSTENVCNIKKNEKFFSTTKNEISEKPSKWCDEQDSFECIDLASWFVKKQIPKEIVREYYHRFEHFDILYCKDEKWLSLPCVKAKEWPENKKSIIVNFYNILNVKMECSKENIPTMKEILLTLTMIASKPACLHILLDKNIQQHFRLSSEDAVWLKKNQIPILYYHLFGPRIFQGLIRNKNKPSIWNLV